MAVVRSGVAAKAAVRAHLMAHPGATMSELVGALGIPRRTVFEALRGMQVAGEAVQRMSLKDARHLRNFLVAKGAAATQTSAPTPIVAEGVPS